MEITMLDKSLEKRSLDLETVFLSNCVNFMSLQHYPRHHNATDFPLREE